MDSSHPVDEPRQSEDRVSAICRFDDGRTISRCFTVAEADNFARAGIESAGGGFLSRAWDWVARHRSGLAKGLGAVLVLLLGSLAIPAATRQWSDRQESLRLKGDLVVDFTEPYSKAYAEALAIPVLGREKGMPAALALRRELRTRWLSTSAVISSRFATYFGDDLEKRWLEHQAAMFAWLGLGCCGNDSDGNLATVRSYLHRHPPAESWRRTETRASLEADHGSPWRLLKCAPHDQDDSCRYPQGNRNFDDGYVWAGQALNNRHAILLEDVLDSEVKGFSSGWTDFLKNLNPFNE